LIENPLGILKIHWLANTISLNINFGTIWRMQNMPSLGSFPNYLYAISWPSRCWEGFPDQQWTYGETHERGVINC